MFSAWFLFIHHKRLLWLLLLLLFTFCTVVVIEIDVFLIVLLLLLLTERFYTAVYTTVVARCD